MRKEYIKPDAEMVKFVEEEDLMNGNIISGLLGTEGGYEGGAIVYPLP